MNRTFYKTKNGSENTHNPKPWSATSQEQRPGEECSTVYNYCHWLSAYNELSADLKVSCEKLPCSIGDNWAYNEVSRQWLPYFLNVTELFLPRGFLQKLSFFFKPSMSSHFVFAASIKADDTGSKSNGRRNLIFLLQKWKCSFMRLELIADCCFRVWQTPTQTWIPYSKYSTHTQKKWVLKLYDWALNF